MISAARCLRMLVTLAMCLLTIHAAVLDEAAGRAVLELDRVAPEHSTVGAGFVAIIRTGTQLILVDG